MGYELAKVSLAKGYKVTLISGPTHLARPKGARFIPVEDARELDRAVRRHFKEADCLFMSSAVCDWRPARKASGKMKKGEKKKMKLDLVQNPDILSRIGKVKGRRLSAGFALESKALIKNAKAKLKRKNLDLIVANSVGKKKPFGAGKTDVVIIDKHGRKERMVDASKKRVAGKILQRAEKIWQEGR
jgi:phosphopantothenoylcysteine decarboxylase/phosphopantothenate--cysteine ligase